MKRGKKKNLAAGHPSRLERGENSQKKDTKQKLAGLGESKKNERSGRRMDHDEGERGKKSSPKGKGERVPKRPM